MPSVRRSAAHAKVAAKYSYLASWSSCAGYKRARDRFIVKLAWAEIFRTSSSVVIWDSREEQTGLGSDDVFHR